MFSAVGFLAARETFSALWFADSVLDQDAERRLSPGSLDVRVRSAVSQGHKAADRNTAPLLT